MHVIHLVGTIGPIYRAVLRVLERAGIAEHLSIVKLEDSLLMTASSLTTARYVADTLTNTFNYEAKFWPWHGDAPSSLAVVWL